MILVPIALLIDFWLGEPKWLYKRLPHPIIVIGRWAAYVEQQFNRPFANKFWLGLFSWMIVVLPTALLGWAVQSIFLGMGTFGLIPLTFIASSFIAYKSLAEFVGRVVDALNEGLEPGRLALSHIVGRHTEQLDQSEIARASVESLAENFSDAVIAPIFWLAIGGLPGLMAYKAINTLDSMWGHRTQQYEEFGKSAAIIDDLANWIPARLSGLIIILSCHLSPKTNGHAARKAMWSDARKHASPNAGWPEAAMAGGLGILVGGTRSYEHVTINAPYIGHHNGTQDLTISDIQKALQLYRLCGFVTLVGTISLAVLIGILHGSIIIK